MQELIDQLSELPNALAETQKWISVKKLSMTDLKESLDVAEINAALGATLDGKNESARKLQEKSAIASDPNVKTARSALNTAEKQLIDAEYDYERVQKQWGAVQVKADLFLAQSRMDAEHIALQVAQTNLKAAQLRSIPVEGK